MAHENVTIKNIQPNGTWTATDGTVMFKFEIELFDGRIGDVFSKSNQPPVAIGQSVTMDITQRTTNNGNVMNKFKLVHDSGSVHGATYRQQPANRVHASNIAHNQHAQPVQQPYQQPVQPQPHFQQPVQPVQPQQPIQPSMDIKSMQIARMNCVTNAVALCGEMNATNVLYVADQLMQFITDGHIRQIVISNQ